MNFYTLSQLKPILRTGDWLIAKGEPEIARQISVLTAAGCIEFGEDIYDLNSNQQFAYIPQQHMEAITSASIVMHKSSAKLEVTLHP